MAHISARIQSPEIRSQPQRRYDRWQYVWSTNCSITSSALRGGPHRNHTHAVPCASLAHIANRSWHSAARRPNCRPTTVAPRALPRATGGTSHAAAARCPGAIARAPCRPRAPPHSRPSPRLEIDQRHVSTRRAVEGAHAAQHALFRRKRAASPPCSARQTRPAPRRGRICRLRREPGALTSALHSAALRAAAQGASVGGRGAGGGVRGSVEGRRWSGRGCGRGGGRGTG